MTIITTHMPQHRPYTCGLLATAAAWMVGAVVALFFSRAASLPADASQAIAITLGSLIVAVAAAVPGVLTERGGRFHAAPEQLAVGFSAGVVIRLLGTVALLGMCSYHFPAAKEQTAGWILAWYVFLTTVEVMALAMLLPRQDGRPEQEAK